MFSATYSQIIPDFQVNDEEGHADYWHPSLFTDNSGNFVITWTDTRNHSLNIYAQRYSSDGSLLGTNFKINDDEGSARQFLPSISADGSGNFVITWGNDSGSLPAAGPTGWGFW